MKQKLKEIWVLEYPATIEIWFVVIYSHVEAHVVSDLEKDFRCECSHCKDNYIRGKPSYSERPL
jgi:hypothetical protein